MTEHKKQNRWKLKESQLAKPIIDYFRNMGYDYFCEWNGIDIMFFKGKEIIAVELKQCLNEKVTIQACQNFSEAHRSYCVVGTNPRPGPNQDFLKKHKVGLISVTNSGEIKIILESCRGEGESGHLAKHNLEWYETAKKNNWLNHGYEAGVPNLKGEGPACIVYDNVKKYLKDHPKADWEELYKNVNSHYCNYKSMRNAMRRFLDKES